MLIFLMIKTDMKRSLLVQYNWPLAIATPESHFFPDVTLLISAILSKFAESRKSADGARTRRKPNLRRGLYIQAASRNRVAIKRIAVTF